MPARFIVILLFLLSASYGVFLGFAGPAFAAGSGTPPSTRISQEKKTAIFYFNRAQYAISRGMYEDALKEIEEGLKLDPGYLPFTVQKAFVLANLGQHDASMALTSLALGAIPENHELNTQVIKNLMILTKDDNSKAVSEITRYFGSLEPQLLSTAVETLTENFERHDGQFQTIIQALALSKSLPENKQAIVTAYLDNKPGLAANLLHQSNARASSSAPGQTKPLLAALSILIAEKLHGLGKIGDAERLYKQAADLGYNKEKMLTVKGNAFIDAKDFNSAAKLYSSFWRDASEPELWAVKAAKAFSAAGRNDEAWKVLQKARIADSSDVYLLGQLFFYLTLADKKNELEELTRDVETQGLPLALEYGKYLVARHENNISASLEARERAVFHAGNITFVHEQKSEKRIMQDLGFTGEDSLLGQEAIKMRSLGWQLWDAGHYDQAYTYWLDSVSLLTDLNSKAAAANISIRLLQQNMPDKALAILKKQFPDLMTTQLAVPLAMSEQWDSLELLLESAAAPSGPLAPWHELFLAYGSLINGNAAKNDERLKKLLSSHPVPGSLLLTVPDRITGTRVVALDRQLYAVFLKKFFKELFQQEISAFFPSILTGELFTLLAPDERAALLSEAALEIISTGNTTKAVPLLETALAISPQWPSAHLGMALVKKERGYDAASAEHLLLATPSKSNKKDYILGRIKMLEGNTQAAEIFLEAYTRKEPDNASAIFELFNFYLKKPDYNKARAVMARLKNRNDGESLMYFGQCEAALGNSSEAEKIFRALLARRPEHAPTLQALVMALRAQERSEEALALLTAHDLKDPEELTLLRENSENAMLNGNMPLARQYIQDFLKISPESVYLNSLYNSSLREEYRQQSDKIDRIRNDRRILDAGQSNSRLRDPDYLRTVQGLDTARLDNMQPDDSLLTEAEEHATCTLRRNAIQRNALESMLDISLQRKNFHQSAQISKFMAENYPYDLHYQLQSAVHAGSIGHFRQALPIAEDLAHKGPNASGMALYLVNVSSRPGHKGYTPADVANYLDTLAPDFTLTDMDNFLHFAGKQASDHEAKGHIPLLLVVGQTTPDNLQAIDAVLQKHDGKAVLLTGEQSFMPDPPAQLPDSALLRRLVDSGRWELALTDTMHRTMPITPNGEKGSFWAHPRMIDGREETVEEMQARWANTLEHMKNVAKAAGFTIRAWLYPDGDYGQLVLDGTPEVRQAYVAAVNSVFDIGMVPSSEGYHADTVDAHFLPVRNVYGELDDAALTTMPQIHPNRAAVQIEAMLASWHGQLPRAERLFQRAADLGVSPRDVTYYQANNAIYDGDAAYANQLARLARKNDTEALRTEILLENAKRMLRPKVSFTPRWWHDNADRSYAEYKMEFATHLRENLAVSTYASEIVWRDNQDMQQGQGMGIGLRYYPFKQLWLDLNVGGVLRNNTSGGTNAGFAQWGAAWRGVYSADLLNINGMYNVTYNRESLETGQSVEDGIYADHFSLSSQMRILNHGVFETEFFGISRTDGNQTVGMSLSPQYIVWDKPNIRMGYLFNTANSDRNPREYYAPQEYANHMAVVSGDYELLTGFHLRAMAGYGTAKSKDKDWEQVVRYSAGFSWNATEDWSINGSYQRLELPSYNMDQFSLGVQYIF